MKVGYAILCFLTSFALLSQNVNLLSVDDGLPQSFVSGIVEDSEGFIWISTRNGLARYDGYQFKIFKHQPYDSISLASNFIDFIKKGNENQLYIRYETGEIDIFDTKTEQITRFLTLDDLEERNIETDRKNWLIGSSDIFWYLDDNDTLHSFKITGEGLEEKKKHLFPNDTIFDIFEDNNDVFWVLGKNFISRYNPVEKAFEKTRIPNTNKSSEKPVLHQRSNGELMWADKEKLHFFDPKRKAFKFWDLPEKSRYSIKWIKTAPDGKDYFESNKNIYSYDDVNGLQQKAKIDIGGHREIRAFLVDKSGLIWIGANTEGLYTVDLATNFKSFHYTKDFIIDVFNNQFDIPEDDVFGLEITKQSGLSPAYYLRTVKNENKLWIAINRSVGYFDAGKEKLVQLKDLPPIENPLEDFSPIKGISITEEESVVVIDQSNTLYVLDEQSAVWKKSPTTHILQKSRYKNSIPNNLFVENDKLWITTATDGLIYIDAMANELQGFDKSTGLPTNSLFGITTDGQNNDFLWVGSSQGLIKINKTSFSIDVFSVAQGLPDNMIYSIHPDNQGYLWLGTNKGLCRFHATTHQQRTFTKKHGLANIEFNRFHSIELPDGKVAFGGISSGVVFNPKLIQEDAFQPKTAITGIKVNNSNYKNTQENVRYNTIETLELPYNQNTVSVEFTALQFSQPEDITYRYRLQGYDKDWIYLDGRREAVYTKIPPGKYLLEINSTNTSGIWSNHTKHLEINILPPFWNTWWARIGFGLIVILLLYFFIKHSISQRVIKNEIALKNKEAENLRKLDEIKTNFFSNITHELRTPLSLIIGPAQMLQKGNDTKNQKRLLSIIVKNADSLLKLTNQLLDIAKLEAGVLKPQMLWGDVVAVVEKMVKSFSEEAESKQIKIQLQAPATAEYLFSPNTLERIVSNLISNALKFSQSNQKITITLFCQDNGITIETKDNGKGIPESDLPHIFKRFYKGDTKGTIPGTGIGLSLVKELVEIHHGYIHVESSVNQPSGTRFEVFLPFEKKKVSSDKGLKMLNNKVEEDISTFKTDKKPLVLIVEDNQELASFLSFSLKQSYNILLAKNGNEGLSVATKEMPDIIISDVLMDGMDGFELCEILKKNVNLSHIPTILLTAKSDMNSKLKGLSLGADDYVTKPFNVSELIMRIDNKLELQNYQRNFFYKKLILLPSHPESYMIEKENVNNDFLNMIEKIIEDRIDDDNFGVEQLAKELNMSRASLHRKVKSITNLPAGEVIKAYKLKKAVVYLNQGLNVSEVAYKTGFGSPSYFTKCFKETYKLTPSEYLRKQELQPNS